MQLHVNYHKTSFSENAQLLLLTYGKFKRNYAQNLFSSVIQNNRDILEIIFCHTNKFFLRRHATR